MSSGIGFLSLSRDIQQPIYALVFEGAALYVIPRWRQNEENGQQSWEPDKRMFFRTNRNLLITCKTIYNEGVGIFYSKCRVYLTKFDRFFAQQNISQLPVLSRATLHLRLRPARGCGYPDFSHLTCFGAAQRIDVLCVEVFEKENSHTDAYSADGIPEGRLIIKCLKRAQSVLLSDVQGGRDVFPARVALSIQFEFKPYRPYTRGLVTSLNCRYDVRNDEISYRSERGDGSDVWNTVPWRWGQNDQPV